MPRIQPRSALVLVSLLAAAALVLAAPRGAGAASASRAASGTACLAPIRHRIEDALLGSGLDVDAVKRSYVGESGAAELARDLPPELGAELDAIRAAFQPAIDERADALIVALRAAIRAALDGDRVTCMDVGTEALELVQRRAETAARHGELTYYRSIALEGRCVEISLLGRDAPALASALSDLRKLQAECNGELARCLAAAR